MAHSISLSLPSTPFVIVIVSVSGRRLTPHTRPTSHQLLSHTSHTGESPSSSPPSPLALFQRVASRALACPSRRLWGRRVLVASSSPLLLPQDAREGGGGRVRD